MKKYSGYSLVELLTVIVIASILMAIAVPAVTSMIRGSASTQAGRELMGRIRAAKGYAVSNQTPVAVVFYRTEKPEGETLLSNYACSAYRICAVKYVEPNSDNNMWKGWVFQNWVSDWYFLPRGIAVGLPETMTNVLPDDLSDISPYNKENSDSLFRTAKSNDSAAADFLKMDTANGDGVSPVYECDLSDIYDSDKKVTFRNAIVFNAKGLMEKPKNLALDDSETTLQPDKAVIIPLRTAVIDGNSVTVEGEAVDYIPLRVDPSGKTYFYDGYVSY